MTRKFQPAPFDGALVIDKPRGRTSHDVVESVRRALGFRQVGHLGTLDPLATGVLVMLLGRATRLAQFYAGRRKRYSSTFRFGFATDTYDSQGTILGEEVVPQLDRLEIERLAAARTGTFLQMPPPFSAKKIHGRPAHQLARKHKKFELKPAEVEVFEFALQELTGTSASFIIECASGTYIRSLAHEMGEQIGCGAHLIQISRTAVGEFLLDQAISLDQLLAAAAAGRAEELVIPLEALLPDMPRISVLPVIERRVRHGSSFNVSLAEIRPGRVDLLPGGPAQLNASAFTPPRARIFNQQDKLIAIAEAVVLRTYQPLVVLDAEA